ncbi:MAG: ferritin-like domain-containing protein [Pseudomonadota bacterium]
MQSVGEACLAVLTASDPRDKVMAARFAARQWRLGRLGPECSVTMPDYPARPDQPELLPPNKMPKRGKGGSERGRIALLHALAHIEFSAIDLAFDLIGRFGGLFPEEFITDWMRVGADEAMHFALLDRRLKQMGSHYGALPAHDGLWEAAHATRHDVQARLAVVPMVLEARGLDITPATVTRFENQDDMASAKILNRIYHDEIRHVFAGTRWFEYGCQAQSVDPAESWQNLVSVYFRGSLKPPFNDSAREAAGLTREYYAPLAYR